MNPVMIPNSPFTALPAVANIVKNFYPMADTQRQVQIIQQAMKNVMKEGEHYDLAAISQQAYFNLEEDTSYTQCNPSTVKNKNLLRSQHIPHFQMGNENRYHKIDLDRFVESHEFFHPNMP